VRTSQRLRRLAAAAALVGACLAARPGRAGGDEDAKVKVTVIAILATSDARKATIEKDLEAVAAEVQKKYPELVGFRTGMTSFKTIAVGKSDTFTLVDDETATVSVEKGADKKEWVRIKVKPPQLSEITYDTCCGKFFPVVTPYETKKKDRLIIAVMVTTCKDK
jgi:hypothetical protein